MRKLFYTLLSLSLILMVVTTSSCKKTDDTYDIRGTWTINEEYYFTSPSELIRIGKLSSEKVIKTSTPEPNHIKTKQLIEGSETLEILIERRGMTLGTILKHFALLKEDDATILCGWG